jgi:hypothetical protein
MKPEIEKKMDEIMYETNNKINAIVDEIRQIKFSKMTEVEKRLKCDNLREEFGKVMIDEEKRIEDIMNSTPCD